MEGTDGTDERGGEVVVPSSAGALYALRRVRKSLGGSPLVFLSKAGGPPMANAPSWVLGRTGVDSTLHGFPSIVRPWMAKFGDSAEVDEAWLAHVTQSQVVHACQRSDLPLRRAGVLRDWSGGIT